MPKIYMNISSDEWNALYALAEASVREPRDQIRYMLRSELIRLGYLNDQGKKITEPESKIAGHRKG